LPRCEKGHQMGFDPRCGVCGSKISYTLSVEELLEIPSVERPREEAIFLLVDYGAGFPLQQISPRGVYILNIALGDEDSLSEGLIMFRRLRSRLWPEYLREYGDRLNRLLKIHGVDWSSNRFVLMGSSSPLALLTSYSKAIDPLNTLLITLIPGENVSAPEAVNSYSTMWIIDRKGLSSLIVTEGFLDEISGYSEELGYIEGGDALIYIIRYIVSSSKEIYRSVSEDRELGIRYYGLAAVIGAHSTVFRDSSHAMKSLVYRVSIDIAMRSIQSIHIIAAAPRDMQGYIETSYREFIRGFGGLLNHTLSFVEKGGRLGTYDLVAIIGFRDRPEFEWLRKAYESVRSRNPEVDVSLLGDQRV